MSDEIASIWITAKLDLKGVERDLRNLGKSTQTLNVSVDDSDLTKLNKHLDLKVKHLSQVNNYFSSNPLRVAVDDSQLDNLNQKLSNLETEYQNKKIKVDVEVNETVSSNNQSSNDSVSDFNQKFEQTFKENISKLSEALSSPFKSIGTGFFEGIGAGFGEQLSRGVQKSLKNEFNFDIKNLATDVTSKSIGKFRSPTSQQIPIDFSKLKEVEREKVPISINKEEIKVARKLLVATLKKDFDTLIEESLTLIAKQASQSKSNDSPNIEIAKQEFTKIKEGFKNAYGELQRSLSDGNLELARVQAETIVKVSESTRARIDEIKNQLKQEGVSGTFGSELATAAGTTKGVIERAYVKPSRRELEKLVNSDRQKDFENMGRDVIAGTVAGLRDVSPVVRESNEVAFVILNSMRKQLGIQSPSRRAWEIAQQIGAGLIGGLTETTQKVVGAANELSNDLLGGLQPKSFGQRRQQLQSQRKALKEDFGSVEFFDAMYEEFGKQFKRQAKKSMGAEGASVGREAGGMVFSIAAMTAPLQTAMSALSPLLIPSTPMLATASIVSNIANPIIQKTREALAQVAPIQSRLTNFAGSEIGGRKELDYLQQTSQRFNVSAEAGANAYSQLAFATRGTRLEGEDTKKLFEGISAAIRSIGGSSFDASLIFQSFTQMIAKGRISMEELRQQLGEKFPPAMQVFAKAMGVSVPELGSLVSKGAILAEDVLPKVANVLLKDFGNATVGGANAFINATTRMENAAFSLNVAISKEFGGIVTGITNMGASAVEGFAASFSNITKIGTIAMIGFTAQIAVGLQAILSSPVIAQKLNLVHNFFLSSFKNSFSLLTPFFAGVFIDLIDDVLGAENTVMDNMSRGVTQLFTGVFSGIDNIVRDFSGESMFNIGFDKEQVGIIEQIKNSFVGFIRLIPPGVGELAALVMMFQQVKVLGAMFIIPTFSGIGNAIKDMGVAMFKSIANARNLKDAVGAILPLTGQLAGNLLTKLGGLALEGGVALATMALARSDFADPLSEGFNEAKSKIALSINGIEKELKGLSDASDKAGDSIVKSFDLQSKGLELNLGKILGIDDKSYKSDDLFKDINSGNLFGGIFGNSTELYDPEKKVAMERKRRADSLGIGEFFTGNERHETLAQRQLLNNAQDLVSQREALAKRLREINLTPDTVSNFMTPEINGTVRELDKLDSHIKNLSEKRVDLSLINTSKTRIEVREIDKQINQLLRTRKEKQNPLDNILGNVDDIKEQLKEQEDAIDNSNLPRKAKQALKAGLEPQRQMMEETTKFIKEQRLYDLIKPLEDVWTRVIDKLRDADEAFERFQNRTKIATQEQQASIINMGVERNLGDSSVNRSTQLANVSNNEQMREVTQRMLALRENSLRELLSISGVESTDARREEIDKLRENIQKDKSTIADLGLQIAQSRANLNRELRDLTQQVDEYYRNIERQVLEQNLEIKKINLQTRNQQTQNRLRSILTDGYDTVIGNIVDSIEEVMNTLSSSSERAIESQQQALSASFSINDTRRSALQLQRQIPQEIEISPIPVELDFSQIESNESINQLDEQIRSATSSSEELTSSFGNVSNSIETSNGLSRDLNNEILSLQNPILNTDQFVQQVNSSFSDVNENVSKANLSVNDVTTSVSGITPQVNEVNQGFNNIWGTIQNIIGETAKWFQELFSNIGQIPEKLGEIAGNAFEGVKQNTSSFIDQAKQGISNFVASPFGLNGDTKLGNKIEIASPSTTQSLTQVLRGEVSRGQSFFAPRPQRNGTHFGLDLDGTEGLQGHANFQSMFPGRVVSMRAWGRSARDRVGGEESNALRIESALPRNLGRFTIDYGHYEVPNSKVKEGQFVDAGQLLGRLSGDDTFSRGGHLDLKIRIPSAIAKEFRSTAPAGNGQHFVDVKEFMNWYNGQRALHHSSGGITVPAREVKPSSQPERRINVTPINNMGNARRGSRNASGQSSRTSGGNGGGRYASKNNHLSPEFLRATAQAAQELGTKPEYLLAVMGFETGGTYSPSKTNSLGFTGLIQFSPKYSPGNIGKTTAQLRQMSQLEQLRYVVPYINKNRRGKSVASLEQLYMSVLMPSAMGRGSNHALPQWSYRANRGLDINRDGKISVEEATSKVRDYLPNQNTLSGLYGRQVAVAASRNRPATIPQMRQTISRGEDRSVEVQRARQEAQENLAREQKRASNLAAQTQLARSRRQTQRSLREMQDQGTSENRALTDLRSEGKAFPTIRDEQIKQSTENLRRYQDTIKELRRRLEDTDVIISQADKAITKFNEDIAAGGLEPQQVAALRQGIADSTKLKEQALADKKRIQQIITETDKAFKQQENARVERANFDEYLRASREAINLGKQEVAGMQERVNVLERIREISPTDARVEEIPILKEEIAITSLGIDTFERKLEAEEQLKRGQIQPEEFQRRIDLMDKENDTKLRAIQLTREQEERELGLARARRELEVSSKYGELDGELINSRIRSVERINQKNPFSIDTGELARIRESQLINQKFVNEINLEKQIIDMREFGRENGLSSERIDELIGKLRELNELQFDNLRNELDDALNTDKLNEMTKVRENLQTKFSLTQQSSIDLTNARADAIERGGGNVFVANAMRRDAARTTEMQQREQALMQLDEQVLSARMRGIEVSDQEVSRLRNNIVELSQIRLDSLNDQFKSIGSTLGGIAKQGIGQLSQGIADVITKGGSLEDVFDNFFNNVLNQVINLGLNSLFGGLFGGLFASGGIAGRTRYEDNVVDSISESAKMERSLSGRKPVLLIAHEGELLVPHKRVQELSRQGVGVDDILGRKTYASGGVVGERGFSNFGNSVSHNNMGNQPLRVEYDATEIAGQRYVTEEQFQEGIARAAEEGGRRGARQVENSMRNSPGYRRSLGI